MRAAANGSVADCAFTAARITADAALDKLPCIKVWFSWAINATRIGDGGKRGKINCGARAAGHCRIRFRAALHDDGVDEICPRQRGRGVFDSKLRGQGLRSRKHEARRIKIEHRLRREHWLAHCGDRIARQHAVRLAAETAQHRGDEQRRLAQSPEVSGGRRIAACLGVGQDGLHDRAHVAANAAAVVREHRGHARYIGWTGIAGDQMLDELLTDEWADIGMIENVVQRHLQILRRCLTRRQRQVRSTAVWFPAHGGCRMPPSRRRN